jgi:alpha-glucosidase (family GH31 glycosyl hydrolase)
MPQPGITFRTIGGLLDFFVFLGPEPEAVVQQYTGLVGRTYMPPYFALGFQICRWGYKNTDDIRMVIERTKAVGIPQVFQIDSTVQRVVNRIIWKIAGRSIRRH